MGESNEAAATTTATTATATATATATTTTTATAQPIDLQVLETRAELSVGIVHSMVNSWLPAEYADRSSEKSQVSSTLLYGTSAGAKSQQQQSRNKLQRAILGRGFSKQSQDKSGAAAAAAAAAGTLQASQESPDKDGSAAPENSKLSESLQTRPTRPRPMDPLSMYLNKTGGARKKRKR